MMTLNLGNLVTFRLVILCGNFSAAADELGLSHPAVSLHVHLLEQFLRTCRVERSRRGIKVSECSHEISRTNMLGTDAMACIHLLPLLLKQLRDDHLLLRVIVTTGSNLDVVRAVEENRVDMGLIIHPASGLVMVVM